MLSAPTQIVTPRCGFGSDFGCPAQEFDRSSSVFDGQRGTTNAIVTAIILSLFVVAVYLYYARRKPQPGTAPASGEISIAMADLSRSHDPASTAPPGKSATINSYDLFGNIKPGSGPPSSQTTRPATPTTMNASASTVASSRCDSYFHSTDCAAVLPNSEPTTTTSGSTAHSSVAVGSGEQLTVWMCSICHNYNNPATIRKSGRDENVCQVCDSAKPDTA